MGFDDGEQHGAELDRLGLGADLDRAALLWLCILGHATGT